MSLNPGRDPRPKSGPLYLDEHQPLLTASDQNGVAELQRRASKEAFGNARPDHDPPGTVRNEEIGQGVTDDDGDRRWIEGGAQHLVCRTSWECHDTCAEK
jgi:hypothetical protein